jgi:hypothetical protein
MEGCKFCKCQSSKFRNEKKSYVLKLVIAHRTLASFRGYTTESPNFRAQGCFPMKTLILRYSLGGGIAHIRTERVPKHADAPIPNHIHKYSGSSKSTRFIVLLPCRHFASLKPFEQSRRGVLQKKNIHQQLYVIRAI